MKSVQSGRKYGKLAGVNKVGLDIQEREPPGRMWYQGPALPYYGIICVVS